MIEAALAGPIGLLGFVGGLHKLRHVPFARHGGAIARAAQDFRDGDAAIVEIALVAGLLPIGHHVPDASLVRV